MVKLKKNLNGGGKSKKITGRTILQAVQPVIKTQITMLSIHQKQFLDNHIFADYDSKSQVSYNLSEGQTWATLETIKAGKCDYVRCNPTNCFYNLVFDLDRDCGDLPLRFVDGVYPPPNVYITNPANNHAHAMYWLGGNAVHNNPNSNLSSLNFMRDVIFRITYALSADWNFTAGLMKNPYSDRWRVDIFRELPYSLGELAQSFDPVPAKDRNKQKIVDLHRVESRNCSLFDTVRFYAYKNCVNLSQESLLDFARNNNNFALPLADNEVRSIVKSVYNYVCRNQFAHKQTDYKEKKMNISAEKRRLGNKNSIIARQAKSEERARECQTLKQLRYTQREIAQKLGISQRAVAKLLKKTT